MVNCHCRISDLTLKKNSSSSISSITRIPPVLTLAVTVSPILKSPSGVSVTDFPDTLKVKSCEPEREPSMLNMDSLTVPLTISSLNVIMILVLEAAESFDSGVVLVMPCIMENSHCHVSVSGSPSALSMPPDFTVTVTFSPQMKSSSGMRVIVLSDTSKANAVPFTVNIPALTVSELMVLSNFMVISESTGIFSASAMGVLLITVIA